MHSPATTTAATSVPVLYFIMSLFFFFFFWSVVTGMEIIPVAKNRLELNHPLQQLFQGCTVQLIVFRFEGSLKCGGFGPKKITGAPNPDDNFEVEPLSFPVIRTAVRYYNYNCGASYHDMICEPESGSSDGSKSFFLGLPQFEEGNEAQFPRGPQVFRQVCSVQVFIPPKICAKKWNLMAGSRAAAHLPFPEWVMRPFHDHSFGEFGNATAPQVDQFQIQIVPHSLLQHSFNEPQVIEKLVPRWGGGSDVEYRFYWDFILSVDMIWRKRLQLQFGVPHSSASAWAQNTSAVATPTKIIFVLNEEESSADSIEQEDGSIHVVGATYVFPYFELETIVNSHLAHCSSSNWIDHGENRFAQRSFKCTLPVFPKFEFNSSTISSSLAQLQHFRFRYIGTTWILSGGISGNNTSSKIRYASGPPYWTNYCCNNGAFFSPAHILLDALSPNSSFILDYRPIHLTPVVELSDTLKATSYVFLWNHRNSMHFISCAEDVGETGSLNFAFFAAYDVPTWSLLISLGALSGLIAHVYAAKSAKYSVSQGDTFGNLTMIMTLLLTQSTAVVHKCRLLCGIWIMVMLVLKEFYEGRTIQEVTAPLPISRMESFQQLAEQHGRFTIYSSLIQNSPNVMFRGLANGVMEWWAGFPQKLLLTSKNKGLPLGSIVTELDAFLMIDNYGQIGPDVSTKLLKSLYRPGGQEEIDKMSEPGYYLNALGSRERIAYAAVHAKIIELQAALVARTGIAPEDVTVSKTGFGSTFRNFHFRNVPYPTRLFMARLRSLFHSGIVSLWDSWLDRVFTWNDDDTTVSKSRTDAADSDAAATPFHKLSLRDNVVVVFLLWGFLLAVCVAVFLIEIRKGLGLICQALVIVLEDGGSTKEIVIRRKISPEEDVID